MILFTWKYSLSPPLRFRRLAPDLLCRIPWNHKWRIRQKRRQRSSLLLRGRILECRNSHLAARMIWRKVFGRTIHFGRVVVWLGVNQAIIHVSGASILPCVCSSINPFLTYHPGAKSLVRHGIEWIVSHQKQRRPLPYLFLLLVSTR